MITADTSQVLTKPPRLLNGETGYDWREFDRWVQRLYLLLGPGTQTLCLNVINAHTDNVDDISGIYAEHHMSGNGFVAESASTNVFSEMLMQTPNVVSQTDIQALLHTIPQYNDPGGDAQALQWM